MQQFLTRKRRPLAKDDFWAIISWLFVGHGAFLLVGTTTFASVVLLVANSLQIQEYVAGKIGKYLTRSTGVLVSFGSAEPNWKDGKLTFKNVRLVCGPPAAPEKDDNYTQFDITVDRFDVTISMARLLEGRGLARSCDAHGVRGIIDRSRVRAIDGWRYHSKPGDFELDSVTVKDALVNIVSADFRPFSVSILHADLPRLRKAYLLYDILCVESAVGLFDKCLFSIHTPQVEIQEGETRRKANYDQIRHLKIDNLNVDHFSSGSKVGPLSWLQRGTVGIDAFVQLPLNYRKPSEDLLDSINMTFENIKENILLSILEQNTEKTLTIKEATAEENPCEEGFFEELVNFRERLRGIRQLYLNPVLERFRKRNYCLFDEKANEPALFVCV